MSGTKVRIVGDGTPEGTKIITGVGETMPNVRSLSIRVEAGKPVVATVELIVDEMDMVATVEGDSDE